MFKLTKLVLHSADDKQSFTYSFCEGINYFVGKNDSGKTEFYSFLDFMFGSSVNLHKKDWFRDSLGYADLYVEIKGIVFILTRYLNDANKNYFRYFDEAPGEPIRLEEYKERINSIFAQDEDSLRELRTFVGEDISYRTFTLFNFLGENRQGVLNDFFDKSTDIRYALKQPAILNYIFNKNLAEIEELKKTEEILAGQLESLEKKLAQNEEIKNRINRQLEVIGIDKTFSGKNGSEIQQAIIDFQNMVQKRSSTKKTRTIDELEAVYTSLDEQIKVRTKVEADCRSFEVTAKKRKDLLGSLQQLLDASPAYAYLVEPIVQLTAELDQSISFNKYLIQESATKELKKQRDKIRNQIQTEESKYKIYSVSDKTQAITLVMEYLKFYNVDLSGESVRDLRSQLRDIREKIRNLQNTNDAQKMRSLSNDITRLYKLAVGVSDLAEYDFSKDGFKITYIKNGNTLQPQISESDDSNESISKNYYTGSMARHTLMQLCGYLAFLRMLLSEKKYPLIPILVVDHISKPFDAKNEKAIGRVIHGAYSDIAKTDLQVFIFDDKDAASLDITPDYTYNLVNEQQSGFNPFYHKPVEKTPSDGEDVLTEKDDTSEEE